MSHLDEADPRRDYDRARNQCPVAHNADGSWTLYRHHDVQAAALDDAGFSSAGSRHRHIPNSLDGAEHMRFRVLIDRYLGDERVAKLEPMLTAVAREVIDESLVGASDTGSLAAMDAVSLGERYAVRAACDWLGWPRDLEAELLDWMSANRRASRSGDPAANGATAAWFGHIVGRQIRAHRDAVEGSLADVTAELMADESLGRRLSDAEFISILRNWTGGDLSSLALCIGVVLAFLADHRQVADQLRSETDAEKFAAWLDEILRIDDPFVSNKRITTRQVAVGDVSLEAGAHVSLNWTAANRDPEVFDKPDGFRPEANREHNLVYGVGRHACPGRALATTELRVFVSTLLNSCDSLDNDDSRTRERAQPPLGGYASVPLVVAPSAD